jgi:predicted nucleic acid-binding protein
VSVLVDTSVWIEFLRATGSTADRWLTDAVREERELAWTEPVLFELLVGATSEVHVAALKAMVVRGPVVRVLGLADFEAAASLARQARASGRPIRSTVDCLIAAVAIRMGMAVATVDRDFRAIAEVAPLELEPIG